MSDRNGRFAQTHWVPVHYIFRSFGRLELLSLCRAAACSMSPQEKRRRMKTLRRKIQKSDIYWWVDSFLGAVFAHDLRDFAPVEGGGAAGAAAPPAAASADGEAQPFIESLSSYRQLPAGGE